MQRLGVWGHLEAFRHAMDVTLSIDLYSQAHRSHFDTVMNADGKPNPASRLCSLNSEVPRDILVGCTARVLGTSSFDWGRLGWRSSAAPLLPAGTPSLGKKVRVTLLWPGSRLSAPCHSFSSGPLAQGQTRSLQPRGGPEAGDSDVTDCDRWALEYFSQRLTIDPYAQTR
ncbi:hypothetical protein OBBRIDRAFT_92484 [Obba rivulosa]|uniref:Uncharacterized protein n=1 Tax=Obba rivulosa TaxID=1052685 RepID=A0A8E2AU24_9APHY|nr:hypothetical protein OBBRIDRAFT_92484 [Obba rivulosa]